MKGEILMENEKKPSRFGVRLSAIMVAVLLVVCMAVPVFAATVQPDEYNNLPFALDIPDGYQYFVLCKSSDGTSYLAFVFNDLNAGCPYVELISNRYDLNFGTIFQWSKFTLSGGRESEWTATSDAAAFWVSFEPSDFYSNVTIYTASGNIFFEPTLPPPPDPLESVGSGLTVVIDWVGAAVSALFSGELSGLLPLVAIPVAITILIVAIVVIKRSIWGA